MKRLTHRVVILAVISGFLGYSADGYVHLDKLNRYGVVASPSDIQKHYKAPSPMLSKHSHTHMPHPKHPYAKRPEDMIRSNHKTRGKSFFSKRRRDMMMRYDAPEAIVSQRAHRYTKRGWVLAYVYDKAEFVDMQGYHYGWFDRYGFTFEGYYFPYNERYRYADRIRGRGYFDGYYYAPLRASYYGFCL